MTDSISLKTAHQSLQKALIPELKEFSSSSINFLKSLAGSSEPMRPSNFNRFGSERCELSPPRERILSISSPEMGLISSSFFLFANFRGGTAFKRDYEQIYLF
jgi:hypothetical protein